jgi:hypothetical protein
MPCGMGGRTRIEGVAVTTPSPSEPQTDAEAQPRMQVTALASLLCSILGFF